MQRVNEGSTAYLTVDFLDKAGLPAVPSSVSYSIYCLTNRQEVRAATAVTPAAQVEITLTPADTAIIDAGNPVEVRRVTVSATYGGGEAVNDDYDVAVDNLLRVL